MSLKLDTSYFDAQLLKLEKEHPKIIGEVLIKTAMAVKANADKEPPKTPHLEGNLRGNVQIYLIAYNLVCIWYTMPYAARWHEELGPVNWSEAGVGPKWLEKQLMQFDRYGRMMAEIHKNLVEAL